MTPIHRSNLARLACYLHDTRNTRTDDFDMTLISAPMLPDDAEKQISPFSLPTIHNECGTVGCALGHGPLAGVLARSPRQEWAAYSDEQFGVRINSPEWNFLFGGMWAYDGQHTVARTTQRRQAANRIAIMLIRGIPAEQYTYDRYRVDHETWQAVRKMIRTGQPKSQTKKKSTK